MGGRFALLIGTGSFRDGSLPHLDSPPSDVRDLAALLRDPYIAGFDPVIELIDASTQQVGREIAHILDRRHRDDLVLLYYAGHALFDDEGKLHLAMHDTELDLLSPTSISAAFVTAEMDRSRSRRQLLMLDCRFGSGLAHGSKGAPLRSSSSSPGHVVASLPDAQHLATAFYTEGRGRVIFAACDDPGRHSTVPGFRRSQVPGDPNEPLNSAFTYALIEGLRGAADLDRDGRITIDELYDFAHGRLAQRPTNLLPCKRGEASAGVPIAYAQRRATVPPSYSRTSRPPSPGVLISDRYLTLSILEEGGLGIVFAARDERTGQPVSVRILRPPGSTDAATLERFMREAQVASTIDHPNVVRILELGFEGRSAFIVMEPLAGESLRALLRHTPRLELGDALDILLPAMSAVSAAHAQNVLHRDLNPENVFVNRDPNGTVASIKVLGFGMSTMLDESAGGAAGRGIRSPHYLPPEQLLSKDPLDVRADVYAFGVMLYEALTGTRPFSADNYAAVLFRIGAGQAEPPSTVCPEVPAAIDAIVRKAMSRDRADRYADLGDLRQALQAAARDYGWVSGFDSAAPPRRSARPPEPRDVKIETPAVFERPLSNTNPPRSRNWVIGVALLAAAGGAAGWLLSGSLSDQLTGATTTTTPTAPTTTRSTPTSTTPTTPVTQPPGRGPENEARPMAATPEPAAVLPPQQVAEPPAPASHPAASQANAPAAELAEPAPTLESPAQTASNASESETTRRKPPMPPNLAAFLADAGIPLDSVTPREARRMLIQARSEARVAARAETRRAREARPGPEVSAPATDRETLTIKPLPDTAAGTEAARH
jgi:serine/threonine protein kinase